MARRVESKDPDQLAYRERGYIPRGVGLPILLVVLGLIGLAFLVVIAPWSESRPPKSMPLWIPLAAVGGVFVLVAALSVFGGTGVVVDRQRGAVTRWWGLFGPVLRKTTALSLLDRVTISRALHYALGPGAVSERLHYPVRLEGARGEKVDIGKGEHDPQRALQLGEEVAGFLGLKLVDGSLGTEIVHEAADVGKTLRQRALGPAARAPLPEPPKGLRSRSSVDGDTLVLDIPRMRLRRVLARAASGMGAMLLVCILLFFVERPPLVVACVAASGLCALILCAVLWEAAERWQVRVSPRELRVTRRGLIRHRTTTIPADRLKDLRLVVWGPVWRKGTGVEGPRRGEPALLARSDTERVTFGRGLSPEELQWIKAVIGSVVSA